MEVLLALAVCQSNVLYIVTAILMSFLGTPTHALRLTLCQLQGQGQGQSQSLPWPRTSVTSCPSENNLLVHGTVYDSSIKANGKWQKDLCFHLSIFPYFHRFIIQSFFSFIFHRSSQHF